jgi:hypothetical protein
MQDASVIDDENLAAGQGKFSPVRWVGDPFADKIVADLSIWMYGDRKIVCISEGELEPITADLKDGSRSLSIIAPDAEGVGPLESSQNTRPRLLDMIQQIITAGQNRESSLWRGLLCVNHECRRGVLLKGTVGMRCEVIVVGVGVLAHAGDVANRVDAELIRHLVKQWPAKEPTERRHHPLVVRGLPLGNAHAAPTGNLPYEGG